MLYYNTKMAASMPQEMRETLERNFQGDEWGVSNVIENLNNHDIDLISIDKVSGDPIGEQEWTHYANLQRCGNGEWEVNTQFNGEHHNEMWIYGTYKRFGDAVRNVAKRGFENRKPMEIYI